MYMAVWRKTVYDGLKDDVYIVVWRTTCIWWFGGRRVYGGLEDDVYMVVRRTAYIRCIGGRCVYGGFI